MIDIIFSILICICGVYIGLNIGELMREKEKEKNMKPEEMWEEDDLTSMDDMIRIERFIKSQGVKAAQIWFAWYRIKQLIKSRKYEPWFPKGADSGTLGPDD